MDEFKVIVVMNEAMIGVLKDKNSDIDFDSHHGDLIIQ